MAVGDHTLEEAAVAAALAAAARRITDVVGIAAFTKGELWHARGPFRSASVRVGFDALGFRSPVAEAAAGTVATL